MDVLGPLKYAHKIATTLRVQPGQLVYCREQTSITASFYDLLRAQGIHLANEESQYLASLHTKPKVLGRPCIVLDRLSATHFSVCFIAQIKGKNFSPVGRFFGIPLDNSSVDREKPFTPLRLTEPSGDDTRSGRFYLFAIPAVRRWIHVPPGGSRYLVNGDLERIVQLVRERVDACMKVHHDLRREQLDWAAARPHSRFANPQEKGVDERTFLRL
ncbi:hypothetical protein DFH08DRAFT_807801 [Mycena albidolilacea]|uniref:Uncharacterized protein n=1 Tax=Mycena albidolilacea TaxID=1033008 RepID=A0AAD7A587_9AGAR|nr:hypothetical protein DFH08DRAFT_807801 [Mycena albidolilacea]